MAPHMKHRLGEILLHKGFITQEELYAAIKEQKKHRQRLASTQHLTHSNQRPSIITVACADEIQRAHRENQHDIPLHNFSITHRETINSAANDSEYDKD